jgi:hypothetical protein
MLRRSGLLARNASEELLLKWFRAKGEISTGVFEGFNNKIRVVTRRSYGFRFRVYEAMEIAFITRWGDSRNQNRPTDSAEEAFYNLPHNG